MQERLGAYLRQNLDYMPTIICTGAAIAFLTGEQTDIPPIVDRLFLGWIFRWFSSPTRFVPRFAGNLPARSPVEVWGGNAVKRRSKLFFVILSNAMVFLGGPHDSTRQ